MRRMWRQEWAVIAVVVLLCAARLPAGSDPVPALVRCALIPCGAADLSPPGLLPLLEGKLAQHPGLELPERAQIATVLGEQLVALLSTAENVGARVQAGKLLGADILVVLQQAGADGLTVTVCDTRRGLRLCHVDRKPPDDLEAASVAIKAVIISALDKLGTARPKICAVPAFVSEDILYQYDSLQRDYQKVIEDCLTTHADALVIEMAEARAIAREHELVGSGEVQRPGPLYFLGTYRNQIRS